MKHSVKTIIAFLILLSLISCIKEEDPCHGAKHIKANFYMQEFCSTCGGEWVNYETSITEGGLIEFISTSDSNTSIIPGDTLSYEWHIGSGVYHSKIFSLNFSSAPDGSIIPVMLIIKQRRDSLCIPNDNGTDTIVRNLKIDKSTFFCFGQWKGTFSDNTNQTTIVRIEKFYSQINQDTFFYISNLEPPYDSIVGSSTLQVMSRQEIPFVIYGNGTFNIYGRALTDSTGQNIHITYSYLDTPSYTQLITKNFQGSRQ